MKSSPLLNRSFLFVLLALFLQPAQGQDQAPLPKVVLLGDSIRLSYTPHVEKALTGQATIISPKANGGDSSRVVKNLDEWAIREQPAFVHFNCGIHDIKKSKTNGTFQVPPAEYEANLRKIVERLRGETNAVVIFALTTPVGDARAAKGRQKVDYELLDASGKVLSKHFVTATSGSGTRGTYDFTVPFEAPNGLGKLAVFELSAADGSRIHQVEIPLTLNS